MRFVLFLCSSRARKGVRNGNRMNEGCLTNIIKIAFSDRNQESVKDNKGIRVRARGVIVDNARLPVHAESPKCVRRTRLHAEGRTLKPKSTKTKVSSGLV